MSQHVRTLAMALESALRWPYSRDILDHIKHGVPPRKNFDPSYIEDVCAMRAGVALVDRELGIDIIASIKYAASPVAQSVQRAPATGDCRSSKESF